jgi:uncharacterized protein GlcG (DUF336 family)
VSTESTPETRPVTPAAPLVVRDVSEALAAALVDGVREVCARRGLALAAVVVDRGGHPVASTRRDGAQLGAMSLAADKASTAVAFAAPTSRWTASTAPGAPDWGLAGTLGGRAVVVAGGVPLYHEGELIGGLGLSGTASAVDEECAVEAVAMAGLRTAP